MNNVRNAKKKSLKEKSRVHYPPPDGGDLPMMTAGGVPDPPPL